MLILIQAISKARTSAKKYRMLGPWVGTVHPINKPNYQGGSADIQEYSRQQDGLADTITEAASANSEHKNQLGLLTPHGACGGGPPSCSTPPTSAYSPTKQKCTKFLQSQLGSEVVCFRDGISFWIFQYMVLLPLNPGNMLVFSLVEPPSTLLKKLRTSILWQSL